LIRPLCRGILARNIVAGLLHRRDAEPRPCILREATHSQRFVVPGAAAGRAQRGGISGRIHAVDRCNTAGRTGRRRGLRALRWQNVVATERGSRGDRPMKTVLATDLDGTFLGGTEDDRAALYEWIARRRGEIVLVFVSGRGFDFMRQLADTLPVRPDHVIGDVGTRVGIGAQFDPLPDVEAWLDACWPADAGERIARAMQGHPELEPQPGVAGRRRSYFYTRHEAALRAAPELERLGFDTLTSDNRFFDVLPRGVQKGPTLLRTGVRQLRS
jgi:hypothetical protein